MENSDMFEQSTSRLLCFERHGFWYSVLRNCQVSIFVLNMKMFWGNDTNK